MAGDDVTGREVAGGGESDGLTGAGRGGLFILSPLGLAGAGVEDTAVGVARSQVAARGSDRSSSEVSQGEGGGKGRRLGKKTNNARWGERRQLDSHPTVWIESIKKFVFSVARWIGTSSFFLSSSVNYMDLSFVILRKGMCI